MASDLLPTPLVPAEVDLRDFAFMPLDVVRLRDSGLSAKASGDQFRAAVLLWCASWHQVPAASLPEDDDELANLCGYGRVVKEWKKVRAGALRGWLSCSDGRLYHPTVAEKALESWRAKLAQRWRAECARIKKHNQRHQTALPLPEFEAWLSLGCPQGQALPVLGDTPPPNQGTPGPCPPTVPRETPSKGQGEGQGQGQGQGQGLKEIPSEPSGSDAVGVGIGVSAKVTDPDEIIFGYGVPMLTVAGSSDKHARSFLAGLRKEHGDTALIGRLRECVKAKPLRPLEWLAAALPPKAIGKHAGFATKNYREGVTPDGSLA